MAERKKSNLVSAGFLLESDGHYLLGHSRNSNFEKTFEQAFKEKAWTIPKGKLDVGETPIIAALREVYEETGMMVYEWVSDLTSEFRRIAIYETTGHKQVIVYKATLIKTAKNIFVPSCKSLVDDPKSTWKGKSEIDHFAWVPKDIAKNLVFSTQETLFK